MQESSETTICSAIFGSCGKSTKEPGMELMQIKRGKILSSTLEHGTKILIRRVEAIVPKNTKSVMVNNGF